MRCKNLTRKLLYEWSPFGYEIGIELPKNKRITVLTPRSTVNTFRAGYKPQIGL